MPRGGRLAAGLVAVAVVAAGCATAPGRLPRPAGVAMPADEATALVTRWEAEWHEFRGLRAAVDLTLRRRDRTDRVAGVLLLSPTQLRFEALAPFGFPTLVVVAGPDGITAFQPGDRKAWTARPTPAAVSRWLGVPIAPETLIPLLIGRVPLPPDPPGVRVEAGSGPHLAFDRGAVHHRVWVTPEREPAEVRMQNGEEITVSFEWTVAGVLQSLRLDVPSRKAELVLRYIRADATVPPPGAFELTLPADVTIERLD